MNVQINNHLKCCYKLLLKVEHFTKLVLCRFYVLCRGTFLLNGILSMSF